MLTQKKYTVVDLFAGAGGLSYGFTQTGRFRVLAAAENNPYAQLTYKENHENTKIFHNVTELTATALEEFDPIDVVIGGPPCQGFSNANRQKNTAVSINNRLVKEFVRVITELQPKVFVMENVSMLKSSIHRFYLEDNDVAIGIADMNIIDDKIELLSHRFKLAIFDKTTTKDDFEAIINNKQFIARHRWSEKRYRLFNSIYKVADQKTDKEEEKATQHKKLLERIEKHKRQLILECNSVLENADAENEFSKLDYACAQLFINIFNHTQEATAELIDKTLEAPIAIQRMLSKWLELIEKRIHIDSYSKDNGLVANVKSYSVLDYIEKVLKSSPYNYKIVSDVLNAAEFGVPQKRMRYIIIGCKPELESKLGMPKGTFTEKDFRTVKDAIKDISDLKPTSNISSAPMEVQHKDFPVGSLAYKLRNSKVLYNHVNTATRETAKKRFEILQAGENFHDLPKEQKGTYTKGD
ncbi:MAG: DNA cytosine methyltransferase, partial [Sporomusaceae bacterium]|nr:DNA cytosine methyltransferase [Sporomusaceae bacterium]